MLTLLAFVSARFALGPRELAMDWDNVGLLLGDPAAEVPHALLALDVTDAVAALAAVAAAYLIVFILLDFDRNYPFTDYLRLALIFIPVQLITYACMGLYGSFRSKNFATELGRLFGAFLLDGLALVALLYVVRIIDFSRWALAVFLVMDLLIVTIKRFV